MNMAEDQATVDKKALARARLAKKLADEINGRPVRQDEFYDHLNATVFKPILGFEITRQAARDIVFGIADQISILVMNGGKVRMGKIGVFRPHVTPPGSRWNPVTRKKFKVSEKVKLAFRPSDSTRKVFDGLSAKEDGQGDR